MQQELREALVNETSEEVLQTILSQLDKNGDSMIDYKEFCEMVSMRGGD